MAQHELRNAAGKAVGSVDLADKVFAGEVKPHLFHEVVTQQLASRRAGTAATKTRGQVRGGGRKPFRQKGTGRARQGTSRSPLMPGGGTIFGPHPRSYAYKTPKKVRKAAVRSALALRREQGKLIVVDDLQLPEIKTKRMIEILSGLGVTGALIVVDGGNPNVELSARNVPGIKVLQAVGLNCYDILRYESLVLTQAALARIEGVYAS
jgi:large subunit ribosomal protein L4